MSYTSTAPKHRTGRVRALLAAFDQYTLRAMNAPAELGGRPARAERAPRS